MELFPCDSKVQNTTLKGVQTVLLYITVLVAQNVLTFQKHKPNLFFVLPPLVKYIKYTCAWLTHACVYTRFKHTHGKVSKGKTGQARGTWHVATLRWGLWNCGRQTAHARGGQRPRDWQPAGMLPRGRTSNGVSRGPFRPIGGFWQSSVIIPSCCLFS